MKLRQNKAHLRVCGVVVMVATAISIYWWWQEPVVWVTILCAFLAGCDLGALKNEIWWQETMIEKDSYEIHALQNLYKKDEQS